MAVPGPAAPAEASRCCACTAGCAGRGAGDKCSVEVGGAWGAPSACNPVAASPRVQADAGAGDQLGRAPFSLSPVAVGEGGGFAGWASPGQVTVVVWADERVREPPGALPDGAVREIGGVGEAVGAVAAEGGEHPSAVAHVQRALALSEVDGAERGVAGGLASQGEAVDLRCFESADGGDLPSLVGVEANQGLREDPVGLEEAALVREVARRDADAVGQAQEIARKEFAGYRVEASGKRCFHAVSAVAGPWSSKTVLRLRRVAGLRSERAGT